MTATNYIADDHRTYAPSLGGVSRDDARQAPVTDARDDVGLRTARKQFALIFGLLAIALALGAAFFDGDLVLYAGFAAFAALISLVANQVPPLEFDAYEPHNEDPFTLNAMTRNGLLEPTTLFDDD